MLLGICIGLVFLIADVYADSGGENEYIVYLNNSDAVAYSMRTVEKPNYVVVTEEKLQEMLADETVDFYEPNYEITLFDDFSDTQSTTQWNLESIKVSKAWNIGCFGNDVKVGVIDSGAYKHYDLSKNLLEGHNYLTNDNDTTDNIGHGTFVSGIIAAEANGQYIDGIAYCAKVVPLKCFDVGYTTKTAMIADAIYDAVDVYNCDVINMSFGMPQSSITKTLQLAVNYALQKGCILVASVGNDGNDTVYYPANYAGVIGVGAVDKNNNLCSFSQRNKSVDVVAPGKEIIGISIPNYSENSGTSFSTPHVSAAAAIAKCIDENITGTEFQKVLQATSEKIGGKDYDESFGYGLISIENIVDKLLENTEIFMSPVSIVGDTVSVVIYNNSDKELQAVGIVANYKNENQFCGFDLNPVSLPDGQTKKMQGKRENKIKFMLWSDFNALTPLTKQREY